MKISWGLLLVSALSITSFAHAEKFKVGDKTYKTAEEARAAADNNRNAWINSFTPEALLASGINRAGGRAVFLMPDDQYIRENFEKLSPNNSIFSQRKPTAKQEVEFILSVRLGIESTPLILKRLNFFDSIESVHFTGNQELVNLDSYNADFIVYMSFSENNNPNMNGVAIDGNQKAIHKFQDKTIHYFVKYQKSGKSRIFFNTTGTPYLFYGQSAYGIMHSLNASIEKLKE